MSVPTNETLIDLLDSQLKSGAKPEAALDLDQATVAELETLHFSAELIREAGLQARVAAIRAAQEVKSEETAVIRGMFSQAWKVAAMVIVLVGSAAVYQFSSTSSSSVYNENFSSYELNTSRGSGSASAIESAYRNKDWSAVISALGSSNEKSARASFLTGLANLELKNFDAAIARLQEAEAINAGSPEPVYQDETEYYLALAYLGAGKTAEGVGLIKKIRNNKNHLFYSAAGKISGLDLTTLELKGK